jgi:two-component system phosphate regulon sensor histidine kinase PhoR
VIEWLPYIFVAVLAVAGFFTVVRKYLNPWNRLEQMVNDLAEGKRPATFVFHGARRFMRVALSLEKLADEQTRLKRQMSEEEFNLQAILSSMVEGVMVVDTSHNIRLVNASFIKLFSLRNSPIRQSVLGALREASIEEILRATSQTGETQSREISIYGDGQAGQPRYFSVSSVPIKKNDGTIGGMVTVFHDISRLRQLEDIRREFVANVSHELRTPLSIFHGYVENLLDTPAMQRKERIAIYEVLQRHSHRLNALLEDLLTLARLESRNEKLEITEISLAPYLSQFGKDWMSKAGKKKITLNIDVDADLPPLGVDEFRLEQILTNLLDNAVKYTPEGGKVGIFARADDGKIEIRVEDNGIGIPLSDQKHIFERFYRVEKARTREKGGTGLGLSIVKHIMALHGGTVEARSDLGKGTAIILRFPLRQAVA